MSEPEDRTKNFLQRWSRRKRAAAERARLTATTSRRKRHKDRHEVPPAARRRTTDLPAFDPATLPPIESITATSDIRAFLAPGVPRGTHACGSSTRLGDRSRNSRLHRHCREPVGLHQARQRAGLRVARAHAGTAPHGGRPVRRRTEASRTAATIGKRRTERNELPKHRRRTLPPHERSGPGNPGGRQRSPAADCSQPQLVRAGQTIDVATQTDNGRTPMRELHGRPHRKHGGAHTKVVLAPIAFGY